MPEHLDIVQIKKELDMKRARIKEEFERKMQEFDKNVEQRREKINAYKNKRVSDIARIEKSVNMTATATLKKLLGEEDYGRLQQWLLEKRKKELHGLGKEIRPTEDEDYSEQLARLPEKTDPRENLCIYYLDRYNDYQFRGDLKRDTGIEL
jgi:hypothetical protein